MSIFRKLGWFFKQEKRSYTIGITALIVVAFLQLIPPKVIGIIIDTIAAGKLQIQSVLFWVIILVLAAVGQYVFRFIWRTHIGERRPVGEGLAPAALIISPGWITCFIKNTAPEI